MTTWDTTATVNQTSATSVDAETRRRGEKRREDLAVAFSAPPRLRVECSSQLKQPYAAIGKIAIAVARKKGGISRRRGHNSDKLTAACGESRECNTPAAA